MATLALLVRAICAVNGVLGRIFSCFSLGIVLVCFTVVAMRYVFRIGSVPLQDAYVWLNGMMFMGTAGYALMRNVHVRVDIFYRDAPLRRKALIDVLGTLFFLTPFLAVLVIWGFPYVERSWAFGESSPNVGGLPGLFVLKSFLLVFVAVVGLQGLAMVLRGILVLSRRQALLPPSLRYADPGD